MADGSARAVLARLERGGIRRTSPRARVIAAALRQGQPFTAAELVTELAARGAGRATVFRTLDLLVRSGVLARIHGVERGARCQRYTPCAPQHHHHLVCRACGRVDELPEPGLERRLRRLAADRGFRAVVHTVEIEGVCGDCADRT